MSQMFDVLNGALSAMQKGPKPLARALAGSAAINDVDPAECTLGALRAELSGASPGDDTAGILRSALARWDNVSSADWIDGTNQNCADRRALIYRLLDVDEAFIALCDANYPFRELEQPTVIAVKHVPWYDDAVRRAHSFYWSAYVKQLELHGWHNDSIRQLDDSTTRVVERLADPSGEAARLTKGLVVGYVQSGKTANFTGVIAKAADAGYKLIIILAGTLDVLRSQTQRRIDKELIGQELLDREYDLDADWDAFLKHGARPSSLGAFDWYRLTGSESDYQKLGRGVEALQFEAPHPGKPLWHKDNLFQTRTRIAIVKKHPAVLNRLLGDLKLLQRRGIGAPLSQIPALIIDDESDQAGINVGAATNRTSPTNKAIKGLIQALPRVQYVGYTATPFANVFVDPDDAGDIFPKDFLLSLPRPDGYMGVSDFYDLDGIDDDPSTRPNERDFVRSVVGADDEADNLAKAIDSFVLSGAIKLFRLARDSSLKFRHHTMLAHVSARIADQTQLAVTVRDIFASSGYDGKKGRARLKKLFEEDFAPVSARREPDLAFPADFNELGRFIGDCLNAIGEPRDAIRILNNETKEQTPDFDRERIWKILIGGNKLSRGYTVEGLTTSYYRRRAQTADTLMQMGRWFGFRRGYGDLVRLFIGTDEPLDNRGKRINLYSAFGAVCRDEEAFRADLKRYADLDSGITPLEIPPLVPCHMLKPTASNKMFNAGITYSNFGGRLSESTFAPDRDEDIRHNHTSFLAALGTSVIGTHELEALVADSKFKFKAHTALIDPAAMVTFLKGYRWSNGNDKNKQRPMELQIEYLQRTGKENPQIDEWLVLAPQIVSPTAKLQIKGIDFGVIYRERTESRFGTYNDPKHRAFAADIAYGQPLDGANGALKALRKLRRAVMIYYPVTPVKKGGKTPKPPFTTGFTLLFPRNDIRSPITFSFKRPDLANEPVVTV